MILHNLSDTPSALSHFLCQLRDVSQQGDPGRFRHNLRRVGWVMAHEVSRCLQYKPTAITTPLACASVEMAQDRLVVATIFRAGLPFHEGFLDILDSAESAFVSAYRYYTDRECTQVAIRTEYLAAPNLEGKTLIVADPMLATGQSMELSLQALLTHGTPSHIHLCCVIAAQPGVDYLQHHFSHRNDIHLWCAAIDPQLNDKAYIVPGLGDAGDLAYGVKD